MPTRHHPDGVVVETRIHDGQGVRNEQPLKWRGRLWFFDDDSMYVYYTPTHWRPIEQQSTNATEQE